MVDGGADRQHQGRMNSSGVDMIGKSIFLAAVAVTAIGLNAFEAVAQSYPTRPVKMILPFPPGGPIDTMGRLVAQHMSSGLAQNVYIENLSLIHISEPTRLLS